jgi:hypothetical protein
MADPVKDYLAAIGQRGGQANTAAQNAARAANGRKGGRPPKKRRKTRKPNTPEHRTGAAKGTNEQR